MSRAALRKDSPQSIVLPEGWPVPGAEALRISERLSDLIRNDIELGGGSISFARYMDLALYAPGLGYYSAGSAKFGPAGDFVTAPEVSTLFGACMARQVIEVLDQVGATDVLELGAGSGALASAALDELDRLGVDLTWTIVEPSASLRARQAERLGGRARWLDAPPDQWRGVVLANEVADALPVERFVVRDGEPRRLAVAAEGQGFTWMETVAPAEVVAAVRRLEASLEGRFPEGYVSEYAPMLDAWVAGLARSLEAGLLLFVDYGLPRRECYAPGRDRGTLRCHYRHRAHADPFLLPGLQDISAWVDFTAVAEAASGAGLELEGFTTQAAFLSANGLGELLSLAPGEHERILWAQEAKQLILPGEMGERFRVMGLGRGLGPRLTGFSLLDLSRRL